MASRELRFRSAAVLTVVLLTALGNGAVADHAVFTEDLDRLVLFY